MKPPRAWIAGLAALAATIAAGTALAEDPTLNESDMDGSVPPPEDEYLVDEYSDPTVDESDFDSTVPGADDGYLGDEYDLVDPRTGNDPTGGSTTSGGSEAAKTPGPGAVAILAVGLGAALALAKRR